MPRTKTSKNLIGLLVSGALVLAAPFLGMAVTMLFLASSFHDVAAVEPSQKAQWLAERISGAMNGAAVGIGVSLLALVPTVIFAVRLHQEQRASASQPGR